MKQLTMAGPGTSVLEEVPVPEIGPDEVLVRMKYCGVCRSELESWQTAEAGKRMGHEPVGTVEKVGAAVEGFKPGDRVSGWAYPALAEYVAFKAANTVKIPDAISDEDATVEPLACVVSAINKLPKEAFLKPVAVIGCGYMGLAALSLLKLRGADTIIAVDTSEQARQNARKLGAVEAYHPSEVPARYLATWDSGCEGGFHVVSEWTGNQQALDLAGRMVAVGGTLGVGGYHAGGPRQVDMQLWNYKAITMINLHERRMDYMAQCDREAFDLRASGQWPFTNLKHKVYPLDQFDVAMAEIITKPGGIIKGLIDCTQWGEIDSE